MAKLKYQLSGKEIRFNRGQETICVDSNNAQFSQLVRKLNATHCQRATIYCRLSNKLYLMLIRALFHSQWMDFEIRLIVDQYCDPIENYLFPLSKTFGDTTILCHRKNRQNFLIYTIKVKRKLPHYDAAVGFYVMSDGKNLLRLRSVLQSIQDQGSADYTMTVVGPSLLAKSEIFRIFPDCQLIPDESIYLPFDKRFPISKKKNLALQYDNSERIVILHDRIVLSPRWLERLLTKHPYFDIYTCKIIAANRYRYLDKFGLKFKGYITRAKRHYYLTYREDNSDQLVDGGFLVLNRRALKGLQFDPQLFWGEMEDVDFILRMKLMCALVTFDPANTVTSEFSGHFSLKKLSLLGYLYKVFLRRSSLAYYPMLAVKQLRIWMGNRNTKMKH
jgi:hypothetical protein